MAQSMIAGNWKMNTTLQEATQLAGEMKSRLDAIDGVQKVVCPPFVSLAAVVEILRGSTVAVGAQNMYHEEKGAYTGEVSPAMLAGLCQFVIVGHSERRQLFGESDGAINRKLQAALEADIRPILCVGEGLTEREDGRAESVVEAQLRGCLADVDLPETPETLVVAYEPVWAIGTGRSATPDVAQSMMAGIRHLLGLLYNEEVASDVPLLYGGSVNAANISDYMVQGGDIDGALVGGASLDAGSFVEIVQMAERARA